MKFCSFFSDGRRRFGFELEPGVLADLRESGRNLVRDGDLPDSSLPLLEPLELGAWLSTGREGLELARTIRGLLLESRPDDGEGVFPARRTRLAAPLAKPGKIIAVGLNYRGHAEEQGAAIPESPVLFAKFPSAVIGPEEPIKLPSVSRKVDVEAELCVVMTERCRSVTRGEAERAVAFMVGNDVSARDLQYSDRQWVRGKSCDTFAPCGPFVVTLDDVGDPHDLTIELRLNDEVRQSANTGDMIFDCYQLVEFISRCITLEPGDVIFTGTPSGVGVFRDPPVFLQPGDVVEVSIEKLGTLRNPVVADL
jgi:2-keto-4-pentenoate hydratase/2-oxohepta-3-ene-1,7-dioic acid hydratase in catechol pathway